MDSNDLLDIENFDLYSVMNSKYDFYDIVKIASNDPRLAEVRGKLGVIRGKVQNEKTGIWSYGVSIYDKDGMVWRIQEKDLEFTGKKADSRDFNSDESVKIQVDPKTGKGKIVDDDL